MSNVSVCSFYRTQFYCCSDCLLHAGYSINGLKRKHRQTGFTSICVETQSPRRLVNLCLDKWTYYLLKKYLYYFAKLGFTSTRIYHEKKKFLLKISLILNEHSQYPTYVEIENMISNGNISTTSPIIVVVYILTNFNDENF